MDNGRSGVASSKRKLLKQLNVERKGCHRATPKGFGVKAAVIMRGKKISWIQQEETERAEWNVRAKVIRELHELPKSDVDH
jgi:hypothetical protein